MVVVLWCGVVEGEPQVPCYFIFGDSLVDNGNNNNIASLARANYLPYGIDFPNGPTGRFSNGKTTVDVIGLLSLSLYRHTHTRVMLYKAMLFELIILINFSY